MTHPDPIDWAAAERAASRIGSRTDVFAGSYHYRSLESDFAELTTLAEQLVVDETGLRPDGPTRARVIARADWSRANIASFRRLIRPVSARMAKRRVAPWTRTVAGYQLGTLLGWVSTRVLGQYDLLLTEDEDAEDQDLVYYVGPNILALEKRFAFPPREFRLWIALHEVAHRCQFTGVPWMRHHFVSLVDQLVAGIDPSPKRFLDAVKFAADKVRAGEDPFAEGGVAALVATPEQRKILDKVQGLMSLLEGHGDVTMQRAGGDRIPSSDRFERVLKQRRENASGMARFLQRALGFEAKMKQYEAGEQFIAEVERRGGKAAFSVVWNSPENLPSSAEIENPGLWLERTKALSAT